MRSKERMEPVRMRLDRAKRARKMKMPRQARRNSTSMTLLKMGVTEP